MKIALYFIPLILLCLLVTACEKEQSKTEVINQDAVFLKYRRNDIYLDTIRCHLIKDSTKNFRTFKYKPYDSLYTAFSVSFNDSIGFFLYGEEKEPLELVRRTFNIFDNNDIIYVYFNVDPPIDGGMLYVISEHYGLLYMKSTAWKNFTVLGELHTERKLKSEEIAFLIHLLYTDLGSIMVRGYDIDEYIDSKLKANSH